MFENFSERGRQTIVLAQAEARQLQHHYIGTEHLLIGILVEGQGVAASVLGASGVTADRARQEIITMVGPDPDPVTGQMPFNPRTRNTLVRANRIRMSLVAMRSSPSIFSSPWRARTVGSRTSS